MFDALDISASALTAERIRLDTISGNIANMNTTHNKKNEPVPYRRRFVVLAEGQPGDPSKAGVHVAQVGEDQSDFRKVYDPGNRDADKNGNVLYPNVDLGFEMINAIEASRAYEANVTTMEVTKSMLNAALRIIA